MKFKNLLIGTVSVLSLGIAAAAMAGNSYYPPERINCAITGGKLSCEGFNHAYLVEDTYTADLGNKNQVFAFVSGSAYFTPDKSEARVFFTYRNAHNKTVKIRSVNNSIRPDFENGRWSNVSGDLFVCKDGYMHCPITSLPAQKA